MSNKRVLVLSDMHHPYGHPDMVAFLKAVKRKFKPDRVICIGDEIEGAALSFHGINPDLPSASDELRQAIDRLKPIYRLFPRVDVVESNHGSLVYRRAKHGGIPKSVIKGYREMIEAPKGWHWHDDLIIKLSDGTQCYFCHGKSNDILKVSQAQSMHCVQGHYHERFDIRYWGNPLQLYWGMTVGCLINDQALSFSYNKVNLRRPVIGCGIIIEGHPQLIPMVLKPGGRWTGKLV